MAELVTIFRNHLLEARIVDPEGLHHEFVSGMHGQKIDFDAIPDESELFDEWVEVTANYLSERYPQNKIGYLAVVSVANGTNRLVEPVAERMGDYAIPLLTYKVSSKEVTLTDDAKEDLALLAPDQTVVVEDVGTSGTTSSTAVLSVREVWDGPVEAVNTWQRREQLEKLVGIKAAYSSIIYEPMPTLTPEECRRSGFCAEGWEFIPHD